MSTRTEIWRLALSGNWGDSQRFIGIMRQKFQREMEAMAGIWLRMTKELGGKDHLEGGFSPIGAKLTPDGSLHVTLLGPDYEYGGGFGDIDAERKTTNDVRYVTVPRDFIDDWRQR